MSIIAKLEALAPQLEARKRETAAECSRIAALQSEASHNSVVAIADQALLVKMLDFLKRHHID